MIAAAPAFADPDPKDVPALASSRQPRAGRCRTGLRIDPVSGRIEARPENGDDGRFELLVTGTDPGGLSASSALTLVVADSLEGDGTGPTPRDRCARRHGRAPTGSRRLRATTRSVGWRATT